MQATRWVIASVVGGIAVAAALVFWPRGPSPPSLPAGSVSSLDVDLQATEGGQGAVKFATADGAKIEAVAAVLRRGGLARDHKCADTGRLVFHRKDGSATKCGLLSGHDLRYYEFRVGSGDDYAVYRVDRQAFQRAMSGLGAGVLDSEFAK